MAARGIGVLDRAASFRGRGHTGAAIGKQAEMTDPTAGNGILVKVRGEDCGRVATASRCRTRSAGRAERCGGREVPRQRADNLSTRQEPTATPELWFWAAHHAETVEEKNPSTVPAMSPMGNECA